MNLCRRWIQGNSVAGMEKSIRDDLYGHLQRLESAFHDGWQSGQLLSRATTDLSSIRKFAGFGTVFLITSVYQFFTVVVLLVRMNWWLGLITGCMFIPVLAFCTKFEREYKVLSRRVQDQEGDLTTLVEEAATGVRVLKALGRAPEAAARHFAQARKVRDTQVAKARLLGSFWSVLDLIRNIAIAVIVVLGALAVSHHALSLGGLVALITLALQFVWPIEALGYIISSGEEAATAAQRVLEIFDTTPEIRSPERIAASPPAPPVSPAPSTRHTSHLRFEHVSFRYPGACSPVLRDCLPGTSSSPDSRLRRVSAGFPEISPETGGFRRLSLIERAERPVFEFHLVLRGKSHAVSAERGPGRETRDTSVRRTGFLKTRDYVRG
jgi:ATP-binding cassette subfamily B protein